MLNQLHNSVFRSKSLGNGATIGIMANKFERVCGHKGYSYDAIQDNEEAKLIVASGGTPEPVGRSRVFDPTMNAIGFDDCDYVSHETQHHWCKLFASVYSSMLRFIDLGRRRRILSQC